MSSLNSFIPGVGSAFTGDLSVLQSTVKTLYAQADGGGVWDHFVIKNHYEKDRKIYQLGVASPAGFNGKSVAFVQIASPTLLWICDWVIVRSGTPPGVPDPTPTVSSWVLLNDWWDTYPVEVAGPDGVNPSYMISGTFIYGHPSPANNTNQNIVYPITPWIDPNIVTANLRSVPDNLLSKGLIDIATNLITKPLGTGSGAGAGAGSLGNGIAIPKAL